MGCNNNSDTEQNHTAPTLCIEVSEVTATTAKVTISPAESTSFYYFDVLRSEYYREYDETYGFQRFIDNIINRLTANGAMSREEALATILTSDRTEYTFTNLDSDTEYHAFAIEMDINGKISTDIANYPFKTLCQ